MVRHLNYLSCGLRQTDLIISKIRKNVEPKGSSKQHETSNCKKRQLKNLCVNLITNETVYCIKTVQSRSQKFNEEKQYLEIFIWSVRRLAQSMFVHVLDCFCEFGFYFLYVNLPQPSSRTGRKVTISRKDSRFFSKRFCFLKIMEMYWYLLNIEFEEKYP